MNNDALRQSAEQRVRGMDNDNRNDAFSKFYAHQNKVNAIVTLEDTENMNKLVSDAEKFSKSMSKAFGQLEGKDYEKLAGTFKKMQDYIKDLNNESNDAAKNAEIIMRMVDDIESVDGSKLNKEVAQAMKTLLDGNAEVINMANNYKSIMKESSETFGKNLINNLDNVADRIVKLSNAFNLQKLVTGGASFKDLQSMQGNVKISMNLDDSGFMGLQKELISQNKEVLNATGEAYMTFSDTTAYLSSIKEYSLKNYNQSTSLYKQVVLGNRYLNLSNQSLSNMVKATNQMADDSYMNKQMALLAALGTDKGLSEDISGLADFASTNIAGVNARYQNGDQIIKDALAIKSTNEAYLGSNSQLYDELMAEIMNTNNFANLSEKTQNLIAMSGMAPELQAMMQSGKVDMNKFMFGFNEGLNRFANQTGGTDSMELYGYGNWVTAMDSYSKNRDEYLKSINDQLGVLNTVDFSNVDSMDEALKKLAEQNVNKTFWEKFSDKMFTMFGIQNQNWTQLNGYIQMIQTLVTGGLAVNAVYQSLQQLQIKGLVAKIAAGQTISNLTGGGKLSRLMSWMGSSSMGASIGGNGALSSALGIKGVGALSNGAAAGLGALGIGAGLVMGFSDASKMSEGEGLDMGDVRGFFLGTGSAGKSTGENAMSVVGNTAKYAAIGAGIGTIVPGIGTAIGAGVGALAGLVTGLIGTQLDDNTEAVKENTKVYGQSTDSIATKSYINKLYNQDKTKGEGAPGVAYGVGAGGTSNTGGYPWTITSPFGPRTLDNGDSSFHNGVDWGIATGTPIGLPTSGTVQFVQNDNRNTYPNGPSSAGTGVNVLGDNGVLYQFWHLSKAGVRQGQKLSRGQTVGLSGNTGYSTGPHLHFGTKVKGNWVNPLSYVTSGLFSADGKIYNESTGVQANAVQTESPGLKQYLSKEAVFDSTQKKDAPNGKGAAPDMSTAGLATSNDINRLIEVIKNINDNQNEQRDFMRALAGKNTFVYGRE